MTVVHDAINEAMRRDIIKQDFHPDTDVYIIMVEKDGLVSCTGTKYEYLNSTVQSVRVIDRILRERRAVREIDKPPPDLRIV